MTHSGSLSVVSSLESARRSLKIEADAIYYLSEYIDHTFDQVVQLILSLTKGRVVTCGIGKSSFIARKVAATLASTGTLAFFLHPSEAAHGDLGMVAQEDVVLAFSHSGESDELLAILPVLARREIPVIAVSSRPESTLASYAQYHINTHVKQEACPLGLAPTTSTTVALALGDALAIALLEARGFHAQDFALSHPAGRLGKRLLVRVEDIMHQEGHIPCIGSGASVLDALLEIGQKGLGMVAVVNHRHQPIGIITDGDIRRLLAKGLDVHTQSVEEVMHQSPKLISSHILAFEALAIMQKQAINGFLVTDDSGVLIGAFNMHDLLKAGVV
jgi:arabinose-5-phosphate isomerase